LPLARITSFSGSVAGDLDRQQWLTFPFTTQNAAALQLASPRIGGKFFVDFEDPPAVRDLEDAQSSIGLAYEQTVPPVGDLRLSRKSSGDWVAELSREVDGLGLLRGAVDSQLDWNAQLQQVYPSYKGVVPIISYSATQDGLSAKATLNKSLPSIGARTSYSVQSLPGEALGLSHEGVFNASSSDDKHSLEVRAAYDKRLPGSPTKRSVAIGTKLGSYLAIGAVIDKDESRLTVGAEQMTGSAALRHKRVNDDDGLGSGGVLGRPATFALRWGNFGVSTSVGHGKSHVRLDIGG